MDGSAVRATVIVLLVLVAFGVRIVRREEDRFIARVLVLGFVAKAAGTAFRFLVLEQVYDGVGDARRYLYEGRAIAGTIRSGVMPEQAKETGTPFMEFLSGLLYTVAPPDLLVGFVVFSLLALIGTYLFLQAFRLAMPNGDHRRYAVLIFFLPTMVFWPSSLGKEAWLVFTLGMAAYGGARVLRRRRGGYVMLALAGAGAYLVRPHMAALFALCFAVAFLVRSRDRTIQRGAIAWLVGVLVIGGGTLYVVTTFADRIPRDRSVEGSAVEQVFAETQERTADGDSEFETRPVTSPSEFINALITVPFRPFPTEAHNPQARIASFEGLMLLGLLVLSFGRLRQLPAAVSRHPYVLLSLVYVSGFVIAFSNVANFGLLARQRAQLVPFLLVLLCLPRTRAIMTTGQRADAEAVDAPVAPRQPIPTVTR